MILIFPVKGAAPTGGQGPAFGWHFYIVSVNKILVDKLADQIGERFQKLKGKGLEKKFLTWFSQQIQEKNLKAKLAIKEEMESSKYGIF